MITLVFEKDAPFMSSNELDPPGIPVFKTDFELKLRTVCFVDQTIDWYTQLDVQT